MTTTFTFGTKADEEAEIASFARKVARMVRQDYRMAGASTDDAPATEVYDLARDYAYDVLLAAEVALSAIHPFTDLVDLLLGDVTESAVALVIG